MLYCSQFHLSPADLGSFPTFATPRFCHSVPTPSLTPGLANTDLHRADSHRRLQQPEPPHAPTGAHHGTPTAAGGQKAAPGSPSPPPTSTPRCGGRRGPAPGPARPAPHAPLQPQRPGGTQRQPRGAFRLRGQRGKETPGHRRPRGAIASGGRPKWRRAGDVTAGGAGRAAVGPRLWLNGKTKIKVFCQRYLGWSLFFSVSSSWQHSTCRFPHRCAISPCKQGEGAVCE